MTVRENLADAHTRMTPAEIAEHALLLVERLEQMDVVVRKLFDHIEMMERLCAGAELVRQATQQIIAQAHALNIGHRKSASRDLIANSAALQFEAVPVPHLDASVYISPEFAYVPKPAPEESLQ